MLVYIPSEQYQTLFDAYCSENAAPITKHQSRKLSEFVATSISNLSHVTALAIDLTVLEDSDDEIIEALVTLKAMYGNLRIIIVAIGRVGGDPLLGRIFAEGIYNFITKTRAEEIGREIALCLSESGMQYSDAVCFRVQEEAKEPEPKRRFSFPKRKAGPKPKKTKPEPKREILKEPPAPNPVIQPPPAPIREPPPAPPVIERVIIKTEVKRLKQAVTIGICGAGRRTGATHQALSICRWLTMRGFKAAYLETNNHKAVQDISAYYQPNINPQTGLVQIARVDMFTNYKLPVVMAQKYDFYIFDYGTIEETPIKDFLHSDLKLVTGGVKPWEIREYQPVFRAVDGFPDIYFLINFSPAEEQDSIRALMGVYGKLTFFSGYSPSPFGDTANDSIYQEIFQNYMME